MYYRTAVYIDGFNLYGGMKDAGFGKYLWLNVESLANLISRHAAGNVMVHYFTALAPTSGTNYGSAVRQGRYLKALATLPNTRVHLGKFMDLPVKCPHCQSTYNRPTEKMTDVHLGARMVLDAATSRVDQIYLVSGDTDLAKPLEILRTEFPAIRRILGMPPRRNAVDELKGFAEKHFTLKEHHFRKSQFSDEVVLEHGIVRKPESWN